MMCLGAPGLGTPCCGSSGVRGLSDILRGGGLASGVVLKIKVGIRCKQYGRGALGAEVERRNED